MMCQCSFVFGKKQNKTTPPPPPPKKKPLYYSGDNMDMDNERGCVDVEARGYRKSLYHPLYCPLNFTVNLKHL